MKKPGVYRLDQKTFIDLLIWPALCLFPRPKAYYRTLVESGSFHVLRCSNTKEQHNGKDHTAQSIAPSILLTVIFHQCSFFSRWWQLKSIWGECSSLPFWGINMFFPQFDGGAYFSKRVGEKPPHGGSRGIPSFGAKVGPGSWSFLVGLRVAGSWHCNQNIQQQIEQNEAEKQNNCQITGRFSDSQHQTTVDWPCGCGCGGAL